MTADARADLEAALAGRYAFERELGRGGMATVYLASDLRHDRPVALKVLHPHLAATLGPERFLREIKVAARLQHPHILTMLDSGDAAGRLWFTMPYIEGESLRDRLTRERQLPVEDALRIAREAADALEYAHRHGVIHRDIKPENILLSENHALVADFGIARALDARDEQLTETGMAVGTPAYMSPEQAAGERQLDARTDVYSLGTVLYEMLAGEPPFTGPTAQAIAARRLTGDVPSVRQSRPAVPDQVDQTVRKALATVPADRFSSAGDFARALAQAGATVPVTAAPTGAAATAVSPSLPRRGHRQRSVVLLGLGFLLGLGVLFGWLRRHGNEAPDERGAKRLAVLPFDNLGAPEDEYFADGITDEIRGKLAAIPGMQVTASRSAAEYKKSSKDLATIARELGVDYLLVGKVRWEKSGGGQSRVRVSPELIQVATGSTKWEQPFDASLTDVFQVQADVAGRVAQALDVALGAGKKQELAERPTGNLAAYDAYLKGEEVSQGLSTTDPQGLRKSLVYYEQAIALDSTFAVAWAQRSRAYSVIYVNSVPEPALAKVAGESAERARQLAPERPEGFLALAEYSRAVANDAARTFDYAQQGLRLAPVNVSLLVVAALAQQTQGRWAEAIELLRKAQGIDPRSAATAWRLARGLLFLRRYDDAQQACEHGLQIAPTHLGMLEARAMIAAARGDLAEARAALHRAPPEVEPAAFVAYVANFYDLFWLLDDTQRALLYQMTPAQFDGDRATWGLSLAGAYALQGDARRARAYADSARAEFEEQIGATPEDAQLHSLLGVALAYLDRREEAVREGRRGLELNPTSRNAFSGPYLQHQLARIYILVGQPDQALDQLEPLLRVPYYLSPGWLRVDPAFDPLRKNPRFQKLVEGTP